MSGAVEHTMPIIRSWLGTLIAHKRKPVANQQSFTLARMVSC